MGPGAGVREGEWVRANPFEMAGAFRAGARSSTHAEGGVRVREIAIFRRKDRLMSSTSFASNA